ncbi:hypothetical protein ROJ8625_03583 [Roseivivax jejudonensis]|uniref:Uncharacterized protein n=1 Tax=Roseivivax jejudonensis TaxID=1529041 RepID=A0A1X7A3B9_9RHOB|nr:hypothetical protein ROJ8625_03583 [Roseivivax jejudonensis]
MSGTALQKLAFVLLFLLQMGAALGWLGGL